jgi:hypothetical protein
MTDFYDKHLVADFIEWLQVHGYAMDITDETKSLMVETFIRERREAYAAHEEDYRKAREVLVSTLKAEGRI